MATVVKWVEDGTYLARLHRERGYPRAEWVTDRKGAMRFGNKADACRIVGAHFGMSWPVWTIGQTCFIRLVPRKRHGNSQP